MGVSNRVLQNATEDPSNFSTLVVFLYTMRVEFQTH